MSDVPVIEHDEETGEIAEPLSVRLVESVVKPRYWNRVDAIEGEGGPAFEMAFFNAQSEISSMVEADAMNPAFKSRYATLATLLACVRPILTKNKLTIKQFPGRVHRLSGSDTGSKQMFLPICTKLTEIFTGECEGYVWEMPLITVTAQSIGSAATTGKRYAIASLFGIATVDDDAAAASIRNRIEKDQGADVIDTLIAQVREAKTTVELVKWLKLNRDGFEIFSEDKMDRLRDAYEKRKTALQEAEANAAQLDIEAIEVKKGRK